MADLMGSYIPDLVLKIDNGELVQLLNHLPNVPAHQTFWEKFFDTPMAVVGAGSALCTLIFSFLTWRVTTKFTEKNHDLAKEQAEISKENKEISKINLKTSINKYNLEISNKKWDLIKDYIGYYNQLIESPLSSFLLSLEEAEDTSLEKFTLFFLNDVKVKTNAYLKIDMITILFYSMFHDDETKEKFRLIKVEIEKYYRHLSSYDFKADEARFVDRLAHYDSHCMKGLNEMSDVNRSFINSFSKNEFGGMFNIIQST